MKSQFQFGAMQNFLLAALVGTVYTIGSFFGGRFAQRYGYFTAIYLGVVLMTGAFLACSQADTAWLTIALSLAGTLSMCLTWPALEALVMEGEPPARLQGLVGVYNCVWAGTAALAFFTGGAMREKWGPHSTFFLPAALLLLELGLTVWLDRKGQPECRPAGACRPPVIASDG